MPFEIIRNDITNMQIDAIVNTANHRPIIGYGVDSAVHKKAGRRLLIARKKIGVIAYGDAAITPAFQMNAKYVVHAVTPIWQGGDNNEGILLENCYKKSLQLALEYGCESIAFPLLASGNHGFPKEMALRTAINIFSKFLMQHEMQIYLVVFDTSAFVLSEKLFHSVQSFIDDRYIQEKSLEEYQLQINEAFSVEDDREFVTSIPEITFSMPFSRKLEDLMKEVEESFSDSLIRLIDQKGMKDPDVYKRANVDRKLFSKIKNNVNYKPSKSTAIAFAIALGLNLDETRDLIGRAGYAMTHSSKFDIIIEYFLLEENYDIFEINEVLFAFGQPLIGS